MSTTHSPEPPPAPAPFAPARARRGPALAVPPAPRRPPRLRPSSPAPRPDAGAPAPAGPPARSRSSQPRSTPRFASFSRCQRRQDGAGGSLVPSIIRPATGAFATARAGRAPRAAAGPGGSLQNEAERGAGPGPAKKLGRAGRGRRAPPQSGVPRPKLGEG